MVGPGGVIDDSKESPLPVSHKYLGKEERANSKPYLQLVARIRETMEGMRI